MQSFVTRQGVDHVTFSPPPIDGSLSIPDLYDYNGLHSPDHPAFVYFEKPNVRTITWSQLLIAVNRAASTIRQHVEKSGPHHERATVVAVLANQDTFTYSTTIMGIMRAGYQAFPLSPRQSAASLARLLLQTRTKYLLFGTENRELAASACSSPSLGGVVGDYVTCIPALTFDDLFSAVALDPSAPAPSVYPTRPRQTDIALILHSSTTVTPPKITRITHAVLLQWGLHPYYGEMDLSRHTMSLHSVPPNHGMGLVPIAWMVCTGLTLGAFAPNIPTTPTLDPDKVLCDALKTECSVMFCVPSLLEGWARRPLHVQALTGFAAVVYAGSTLRRESAERLWKRGVKLVSSYGAIAIGCVTSFLPATNDHGEDLWNYFKFSPNCMPKMIPRDGNVYHLLFTDCSTHILNVINVESNEARYFDTHDLVVRHPTKPDLWRIYGRTDDVIMQSNSHKTNPLPIEDIISRHRMIKSCLLFGHGRRFLGLLVEPSRQDSFDVHDSQYLSAFVDNIWPIIEEANRSSPDLSRIAKDMIMVTRPSKPFRLTARMTLDRINILKDYEQEIDDLYRSIDPLSPIETPPNGLSTADMRSCIGLARMGVEKYLQEQLEDDDDLFQAGCDSLQATSIRNAICSVLHHNLKLPTRNIPYNVVYTNPTIRKLGQYVAHIMCYGQAAVALCTTSSRIGEMEAMVRKYSSVSAFPIRTPPPPLARRPKKYSGEVVLLTGSTGALGSHLLHLLIKDATVDYVYALNRPDSKGYRSVYIRQATGFKDRDLDYSILNSEKLQLLEGNLHQEYLGLEEEVYEELRREVTCVIHNSWTKNWGTTLPSLEPLVAGTRRLIDFALSSSQPTPLRFVFVSTLTYMNWQSGRVIPEAPNPRPATALGTGYTESKWIAENLLVKAAEETGLSVSIIRVGQLSGGPNGSWNPKEWLPSLIRSAQVVQCLPNPHGVLSWMPVHLAAAAILEMRHKNTLFMNLAHPNPVPATVIFRAFSEALQVPLVDYTEWLIALEASIRAGTSLTVLSLLDFYRGAYRPLGGVETEAFGMALAETGRAMEASPSLKHCITAQLGSGDVDTWVRYWRRIGLLAQR